MGRNERLHALATYLSALATIEQTGITYVSMEIRETVAEAQKEIHKQTN
ncbi:hypothetical protein HUG15_00325 [Salicibibacter cibarius]|uniref:Uncharacterized protein n=1 Tax=Salicibibacter cibarius TaxID=2743000 RepID=A0A7T6YZR3_9BACI|nr:hypothetical protein [Salicibibacter cibarius]QQK74214.1 hypothetical protein HUG15_00325 [Salicibibacter cibarius]